MKRILGCFAALFPEPTRGTWESGTLASVRRAKLDAARRRDLANFMVILGILKKEKWIRRGKYKISAANDAIDRQPLIDARWWYLCKLYTA